MNKYFTGLWLALALYSTILLNAQTPDSIQVGFPSQFQGSFQYLNAIPAAGLDLDDNGTPDIGLPCSCRSAPVVVNGQQTNTGVFDSWLIIAGGASGRNWQLQYAAGVLHPVTLSPLLPGTPILEVGQTGIYVLHFAHRDAAQYVLVVENVEDYPGHTFGPVINTCYYPDPYLAYLEDFYCSNSSGTLLYGGASTPFDEHLTPLNPVDDYWVITRQQDGQTYSGPLFNPEALGQGHYSVRYTFDAGANAFTTVNKTGCTVTVEAHTTVRQAGTPSCQSSINITLNPTQCQAEVTPAMLMTTTPITYRGFSTEVLDPFGNSLGTTIPAQYAYIPLLGVLTDSCTGLYCTTQIIARDVHPPVLTVPANATLPCTSATDPTTTGMATATDCAPVQTTYTDEIQTFPCGLITTRITRTWLSTDVFGNTVTATQIIQLARGTQAQLRFPPSIVLECSQYSADPTLTDPLPGKAGVPNLVDTPACGLTYNHRDDTIGFCGNPLTSFIILRTWTVLDACGFQIYTTDGAGNSNVQIIQVKDETPPIIQADTVYMMATLPSQQNGLSGCSAVGFIPPPLVTDACNTATVRIFTPVGEARYINGSNANSGGWVPFPGLQLGVHPVRYEARDACGNTSEYTGYIQVVDSLPPVMLCNGSINLTLNAGGQGRITPLLIDNGSRDDCCLGNRQIKLASEPDSAYRNFIDLDCPTHLSVQVSMRVTDCAGNFNDCQATVYITDPVSPSVVSSPSNMVVTCLDDPTVFFNPSYQAPVFADNCPFDVAFQVQSSIDSCGNGSIQRQWRVGDAVANQTVQVNGVFRYRFVLPNDLATSCSSHTLPGDVQILLQTCDNLVVSVVTDTITLGAPARCRSMQRTFTIVNLCETSANTPPVTLPRLSGLDAGKGYEVWVENGMLYRLAFDGSLVLLGPATGSYRYVQRWDILDGEAPQFAFSPPVSPFCATDDCTGPVILDFQASDNCAPQPGILHRLRLHNQGVGPDNFGMLIQMSPGQYRIAGNYPVGVHTIELVLDDECGNVTTGLITFEVRDCAPPTLECRQDIILTLGDNGQLEIRPQEFPLLAQDNCSGALLSFSPITLDTLHFLTCDSVGFRAINIWMTDANGHQSACQSNIQVVAPPETCPETWSIRGIIRTEHHVPIAQVNLKLSGGLQADEWTLTNGQYEFLDVPGDRAYIVRPEKLSNPANGISTFDLVLISRHILGVQLLDSPYKLIAADINRSGSITTLDMILLRRMILGVDSQFAGNTSWRFVPADFQFPVPSNPFFGAGFPEEATLPNLKRDTVINFIGIKVGDVNASAQTQ